LLEANLSISGRNFEPQKEERAHGKTALVFFLKKKKFFLLSRPLMRET